MYRYEEEKINDAIRYIEIAYHDKDVNPEYPITEKDIDEVYNILIKKDDLQDLKHKIMQTLVMGNNVYLQDSKDKAHILGRGYCENLDLINYYIEQLKKENITAIFQESERTDLYIDLNKKLDMGFWKEV